MAATDLRRTISIQTLGTRTMRRLLPFAIFTTLHFVLSFGALFVGGGLIMSAFDGKGSDALASLAALVMGILTFPVVTGLSTLIPVSRLGTVGEYALFVLNSMLWGLAGARLWSWWRTRRRVPAGA